MDKHAIKNLALGMLAIAAEFEGKMPVFVRVGFEQKSFDGLASIRDKSDADIRFVNYSFGPELIMDFTLGRIVFFTLPESKTSAPEPQLPDLEDYKDQIGGPGS